jgi:hypothetical protein
MILRLWRHMTCSFCRNIITMSENKLETNGTAKAGELDSLLTKMLGSSEGISDLLFVAGKPPQVETHGALKSVDAEPALDSPRIEGLKGVSPDLALSRFGGQVSGG